MRSVSTSPIIFSRTKKSTGSTHPGLPMCVCFVVVSLPFSICERVIGVMNVAIICVPKIYGDSENVWSTD